MTAGTTYYYIQSLEPLLSCVSFLFLTTQLNNMNELHTGQLVVRETAGFCHRIVRLLSLFFKVNRVTFLGICVIADKSVSTVSINP